MNDDREFAGGTQPETRAGTAERGAGRPPIVIDVRELNLSFEKPVLCDISFQIRDGETLAIVGPSGVGKSTILKLILRLLVPDSGQVIIDGEDINHLSFEEVLEVRQKMGMVFQAAALFDSLSVYENVAYPLREHMRLSEEEIEDRVRQALVLVDMEMEEFALRLPAALSGGQKKRVGIARAIVHQPKLLLYDEPTTGLDPLTSRTIVHLIKRLQREIDVTGVVVSHDVKAVLEVSTHIAMLRDCRICFYGTPEDMIASTDPYVREFMD